MVSKSFPMYLELKTVGGKEMFKGERKILGKCSGSVLARCACLPLHPY